MTEVCEALVTDPNGVYVDCTLGGGGHSSALLEGGYLGPGGRVLGLDRDPDALAAASHRLRQHVDSGRFRTARSDFRHVAGVLLASPSSPSSLSESGFLPDDGLGVHGLLLDLGVSSHQLDQASRGFSFGKDGPLDMRMEGGTGANQRDSSGGGSGSGGGEGMMEEEAAAAAEVEEVEEEVEEVEEEVEEGGGGMSEKRGVVYDEAGSAASLVNELPVEELRRVLSEYGEEPRAARLASKIAEARPISTTAELVDVVRGAVGPGPPKEKSKVLARVFQALRIAVNDEMGALETVLASAAKVGR